MTLYFYLPSTAIDINGNLVTSGTGNIYAPDDAAGANALPIKDENQMAINGGLTVTPLNLIPGFALEGYPVVLWRSGSIVIPLEAAGARIPRGGTTGQVISKASVDDYDVAWIDPPASSGGGGGGGGTGVSNGDYWNRQQTVPVVTISATAPWPTDAPAGALIVRLSGAGA